MHKKSHIKNLEDIIEEFRVGNYDSFDEFYRFPISNYMSLYMILLEIVNQVKTCYKKHI